MSLNAGTPLHILTDRLAKAGWGDLGAPDLRVMARVLDALASTLNTYSGAGYTTAPQLAEKTCYTERWVRRGLTLLEQLDLIEWHRGGIQGGKPTPSWIRVSKALLADLVAIARRKQGERLAEASRATRERVAKLRTSYTQKPGRRKKSSRRAVRDPHAEVGSALLSLNREEVAREERPPSASTCGKPKIDDAAASTDHKRSTVDRIKAEMAALRQRRER